TIGGLLDHRFHLAGLAKMALLKVNTFQPLLHLLHGLLKVVKPDDSLLAVAAGTSDSVALAPPLFTVRWRGSSATDEGLLLQRQWHCKPVARAVAPPY